jgi:ketosteroid isomerase-like protein
MSTDDNKATIRRFYDEVWHTNGEPAFDRYLAPEAASYRQQIEALRATYPDIHFDLLELIAEGDAVAAHWSWRGTHRTEGVHEGSGVSIWHLRDGRIVDRLAYSDVATAANVSRV